MKLFKFAFAILLLLSFLVPSQLAHADVAPPPAPELGGLQPFQDTEVQMVYERVEMELESFRPDWDPETTQNRIVVNAYFVLKNQGNVEEGMQVVFPLETMPFCSGSTKSARESSFTYYSIDQDSFKASVDGIIVPVTQVQTKYGSCDNYPWAEFYVTFPVDKDVLIKVAYVMETQALDSIQVLEYILETGAGWKGTIGSGYVIMKFPYTITADTILSSSTTGYQVLQNEVYWSFQNLEPTAEDNIQISFISPDIWSSIQKARGKISQNPASADAWLDLVDDYEYISTTHGGDIIRDDKYFSRVEPAYQQAVAENPNNAELPARYAQFKLANLSPHLSRQLVEDEAAQILSLLNKALALEPNNETAQQTLSDLLAVAPFITFTPPVMIPPTATSQFTATPSITPSATITSTPTETPVVVTVVQTKLVYAPTSTSRPKPTETGTPIPTAIPTEQSKETNSSSIIFGMLGIFVAGIGSGWFLSKRQKK